MVFISGTCTETVPQHCYPTKCLNFYTNYVTTQPLLLLLFWNRFLELLFYWNWNRRNRFLFLPVIAHSYNVVADTLSRIDELQSPVDTETLAKSQSTDAELSSFLYDEPTSLRLEKIKDPVTQL